MGRAGLDAFAQQGVRCCEPAPDRPVFTQHFSGDLLRHSSRPGGLGTPLLRQDTKKGSHEGVAFGLGEPRLPPAQGSDPGGHQLKRWALQQVGGWTDHSGPSMAACH